MKKNIIILCLFLFLSIILYSQETGLGIGIILGEPTGLSGKLWISNHSAFDLGIAWAFYNNENSSEPYNEIPPPYFSLHCDYLYHFFNLLTVPSGSLSVYCGGGIVLRIIETGIILGLRIPAGFVYLVEKIPLDIFVEIVPVMELIPGTMVSGNGGIGIRYFLKL